MTQLSRRRTSRLESFLNETLPLKHADLLLLTLSFATAMVDVVTFSSIGVFVANMTGNIIFLAIGAIGTDNSMIHPARSIVALISFWFGSLISGRLGARFGTKTRGYLFTTFLFQSILILLVALLLFTHKIDIAADNDILAFIAPMAIAFGMQAAVSRPFGIAAITTVVVTSAMVDLFCDPKLFVPWSKNVSRNHRIEFVIVFFLGGILAAGVVKASEPAWALVVAALIKMGVAAVILLLEGTPLKDDISSVASSNVPHHKTRSEECQVGVNAVDKKKDVNIV